jgi:alpha-1,3-mannosyltransferase
MLELALGWFKELAFNRRYFWVIAAAVLLGDAALTQLIIRYVPCR